MWKNCYLNDIFYTNNSEQTIAVFNLIKHFLFQKKTKGKPAWAVAAFIIFYFIYHKAF